MRKMRNHPMVRSMRRKAWSRRYPWRMQRCIDIFYQLLIPLIIFQLIRTLLLPTTFDVILLTTFVLIYVFQWIK